MVHERRSMTDAKHLMEHARYGIYSRHDLVAIDGTRIPQGTTYVNVGQPEGITVKRYMASVPIVLTEVRFEHLSPLKAGMIFLVNPTKLLVAVDEIAEDCECAIDSRTCYNREVQNGLREPLDNRPDPRKFLRRTDCPTQEQIDGN